MNQSSCNQHNSRPPMSMTHREYWQCLDHAHTRTRSHSTLLTTHSLHNRQRRNCTGRMFHRVVSSIRHCIGCRLCCCCRICSLRSGWNMGGNLRRRWERNPCCCSLCTRWGLCMWGSLTGMMCIGRIWLVRWWSSRMGSWCILSRLCRWYNWPSPRNSNRPHTVPHSEQTQ